MPAGEKGGLAHLVPLSPHFELVLKLYNLAYEFDDLCLVLF